MNKKDSRAKARAKKMAEPGVKGSPKAAKSKGVPKKPKKSDIKKARDAVIKRRQAEDEVKAKEYSRLAKGDSRRSKDAAKAAKARVGVLKANAPRPKTVNLSTKHGFISNEPDHTTGNADNYVKERAAPVRDEALHAHRMALRGMRRESRHEAAMARAREEHGVTDDAVRKSRVASASKRSGNYMRKHMYDSPTLLPTHNQIKNNLPPYSFAETGAARKRASDAITKGAAGGSRIGYVRKAQLAAMKRRSKGKR
jgi:hypothetical protein